MIYDNVYNIRKYCTNNITMIDISDDNNIMLI